MEGKGLVWGGERGLTEGRDWMGKGLVEGGV